MGPGKGEVEPIFGACDAAKAHGITVDQAELVTLFQ